MSVRWLLVALGACLGIPTASADDLKQRCEQLIAYYDYYGVSRGENSDGPRNHARIRAFLECQCGDYRSGITRMIALMRSKAMTPPAASVPFPSPEDE